MSRLFSTHQYWTSQLYMKLYVFDKTAKARVVLHSLCGYRFNILCFWNAWGASPLGGWRLTRVLMRMADECSRNGIAPSWPWFRLPWFPHNCTGSLSSCGTWSIRAFHSAFCDFWTGISPQSIFNLAFISHILCQFCVSSSILSLKSPASNMTTDTSPVTCVIHYTTSATVHNDHVPPRRLMC